MLPRLRLVNQVPTTDNQISQHPFPGGHGLGFSWNDHTGRMVIELAKLKDEKAKISDHVKIINSGVKWMDSLFVFAILQHFTTVPSLMPTALMQQGHRIVYTFKLDDSLVWYFHLKVLAMQQGTNKDMNNKVELIFQANHHSVELNSSMWFAEGK